MRPCQVSEREKEHRLRHDLLSFLVCPRCQDPFTCEPDRAVGGDVIAGSLRCPRCSIAYPIRDGIPRIMPPSVSEEQERTAGAFGWEWRKFSRLHAVERYTEQFLDWIAPLTPDAVRGKIVLDGGCGMGRFPTVVQRLGAAQVVGVDISLAVEAARDNTRDLPNVHIVQSDIYNLPLRRDGAGQFDFIYSIGVLHHMPDPEAGFLALCSHLKPGAEISVWVYGYENNEWYVRVVNPIRLWFTSRIPHSMLHALSFAVAVPLHLVIKALYLPAERVRGLGFLRTALPYKYLFWLSRFGFRHTHHVIFDQLVAPKAEYLKREAFAAWFRRAGLEDVRITARNENSWRGYGRKPAMPAMDRRTP